MRIRHLSQADPGRAGRRRRTRCCLDYGEIGANQNGGIGRYQINDYVFGGLSFLSIINEMVVGARSNTVWIMGKGETIELYVLLDYKGRTAY